MESILLATPLLLFQLWMPTWDQRPIQMEDLDSPKRYAIDETTLPLLSRALATPDLLLKERLYILLASQPIPANQDFLLTKCLPKEKHEELQATILHQLANMDLATIPPATIAEYTRSKSTLVAREAIRLYGMLPEADPRVLVPFLGKPNETNGDYALKKAAWQAFAAAPRLANTLGRNVLLFKDDANEEIRLLAFKTALAQQNWNTDTKKWQDESCGLSTKWQVAAAGAQSPVASSAPATLLKSPVPAVRVAVCQSRGMVLYPNLLCSALSDKETAVRLAALTTLRELNSINGNQREKLVPLFNDPSRNVRQAAQETYAALAPKSGFCGEELLPLFKTGTPANSRLHALNLLRILKYTNALETIKAQLANRQNPPQVLAAALDAISVLGAKDTADAAILACTSHPSPLVRQMAARACGRLRLPDSQTALLDLAKAPNPDNVRDEAFEAMGRYPRPEFIPALTGCLKNTGSTSARSRANAAWALGQQNSPSNDKDRQALAAGIDRMVVQCTVPVIAAGPEHVFDDNVVLVNCMLSVAVLARRLDDDATQMALATLARIYDVPMDQQDHLPPSSTSMPPPTTDLTYSVMHQAIQWCKGETPEQQPLPTTKLTFPVEALSQKATTK